MVSTPSVRIFCLGILNYLSRNPVFLGKFPFGKTNLVFPYTFHSKFAEFRVNGKQPGSLIVRKGFKNCIFNILVLDEITRECSG